MTFGTGTNIAAWHHNSAYIPKEIREHDGAIFSFNRKRFPDGLVNPQANPVDVSLLTQRLAEMSEPDQQQLRDDLIQTMLDDPDAVGVKRTRQKGDVDWWVKTMRSVGWLYAIKALATSSKQLDCLPEPSLKAFRQYNATLWMHGMVNDDLAVLQKTREKMLAVDLAKVAWLNQRGDADLAQLLSNWQVQRRYNERAQLIETAANQEHEADWTTYQIGAFASACVMSLGLAALLKRR